MRKIETCLGYYENSIAYAFCVLRPEVAGDFQIRVASDDGVAVWINGKQVDYKPGNRNFIFDQDVIDVNLKADANRCLVKMSFGSGPWCFAVRVFPPNRVVISGVITDEKGKPIPIATISLEQDGKEITQALTDASGSYRLGVYPVRGPYDLSVTSGELGDWQLGIRLREGERRTLNFTLKNAISIEGTLLMLDDKTPHVAVPVQAISNGKVIATTLSDKEGKYRFINVKPGQYQVRCYPGKYLYFGQKASAMEGTILHVKDGASLKNIDFRFPPFKKGTWKTYTHLDGLASNSVPAIYSAPDGILWFGTRGGGVSRYDGKEFKNFTTKDGLAHNNVWSIHPLPDGTLCFGTGWVGVSGGVSRYDGKNFEDFTVKVELPRVQYNAFHGASDGTMWFGAWGGAFQYDGKKLVNFLAGKIVWAIHQAPDGAIWFVTQGSGVFRYDGKEFKNFTEEDGLADNWVFSIHADSDGALWFGTSGGVSRYEGSPHFEGGVRGGKKFVNFTKKDGLAGNGVTVIYRDLDGRLWFGTWDGGVSCYDGITWTSLDTRDGLAGNNVFSISQDSDGSLWFGTDGGVTHYRRASVPPKVHIVSVTTDKTYRELDAIPSFPPGARVTIEYSAIDFKTVPEKRQYRCRVTEIDRDWRKPTKSASFDYTFDKPGVYTFEVQAIDRDLNYSEPANVTLKVAQPFYLRTAFLAPTVSLGALLLAALVIQAVVLVKHRRQVLAYQRLAVQELQDANRVQMSLMPKTAPEIEGVEIAGKCIPANTVSGDFFDYLKGKDEIGLVVADVTGKAMKGAMNAVMADGVLRATAKAQEQLSPASLMSKLNDVLKVSMEWGMNITMVIATIKRNRVFPKNSVSFGENSVSEWETTLALANAAHHAHPLLLRNCEIQALKTGGLPLGMRAGVEYSEEAFTLQSGDVLILMTDGIIEAQDREGKLYSDSRRLEETISQFPQDLSAEAMVNAVINDAINFGGDKTTRDDDMTVVVAKIK